MCSKSSTGHRSHAQIVPSPYNCWWGAPWFVTWLYWGYGYGGALQILGRHFSHRIPGWEWKKVYIVKLYKWILKMAKKKVDIFLGFPCFFVFFLIAYEVPSLCQTSGNLNGLGPFPHFPDGLVSPLVKKKRECCHQTFGVKIYKPKMWNSHFESWSQVWWGRPMCKTNDIKTPWWPHHQGRLKPGFVFSVWLETWKNKAKPKPSFMAKVTLFDASYLFRSTDLTKNTFLCADKLSDLGRHPFWLSVVEEAQRRVLVGPIGHSLNMIKHE